MTGRYVLSLPERCVRALFAVAGGAIAETAQVVLPRFVRRSRLYEATAKNALRIAVELVGDVPPPPLAHENLTASRVAMKKAAGNVVELGTIAAFGFSPVWLLAAASDILNGTRTYLRTLEDELAAAGVLRPGTHFGSVDQLLRALEGTAGEGARLVDLPPLELAELRASIASLRADASSLPSRDELAALFTGLTHLAQHEHRTLLELSSAIGLAMLGSAKKVGRVGIAEPYREDWKRLLEEGLPTYAVRVARPYRDAAVAHLDSGRVTHTERLPQYGQRFVRWLDTQARHRRSTPP